MKTRLLNDAQAEAINAIAGHNGFDAAAALEAYPELVAALRELCADPSADFVDCPLGKARALLAKLGEGGQ